VKIPNSSQKKYTVVHIMPWSGIGGVEIATLRLAESTLHQARHVAFCMPDALALQASFKEMGVETVTYVPPVPSLRHAGRFLSESRIVAHQIREVGADIVHFADERAAQFNSLAALLSGSRIVCHLRVSYPHLSLRQRLGLLPVHSFIFVSEEVKQTFGMKVAARKARVIYDAVDVSTADMTASNAVVRRELGVPLGSTIVGMTARVSRQKDYYTLAASAVCILAKHPATRFLIVGDNSLVDLNRSHYKEVANRLDELGISDKFIFAGHRTDVPRLIAAMDICVLCTHREGFPLSILESLAMRKPVVATAVGGIPEIIQPGVTGYLHQHENSKELAEAVISLIDDPERAAIIGDAGFEHVRRNYSRQKFTDEVLQAYSDVIKR